MTSLNNIDTSVNISGAFILDVWGDSSSGVPLIYATSGGGIATFSVDSSGFITYLNWLNTGQTYCYCITGDGTYLYAGTRFDSYIITYTVSTSGVLTEVDRIGSSGSVYDLWTDGSYVYAASSSGGLRTYSISGGSLSFESAHDAGGDYINVWGDGTYLYISNLNGSILSYTTGSTPALIDSYSLGGSTNYSGVSGDGNFIYMSCYNAGNGVYGLYSFSSTAGNLTYLDRETSNSSNSRRSVCHGGFIFVSSQTQGTNVYSVDGSGILTLEDSAGSNSQAPFHNGTYLFTGSATPNVQSWSLSIDRYFLTQPDNIFDMDSDIELETLGVIKRYLNQSGVEDAITSNFNLTTNAGDIDADPYNNVYIANPTAGIVNKYDALGVLQATYTFTDRWVNGLARVLIRAQPALPDDNLLVILNEKYSEDVDDDFTGDDGDPPNSTLWNPGTDNGSTRLCRINSNRLRLATVNVTGYQAISSVFHISGDFDIQVDWEMMVDPGSESTENYILAADPSDATRWFRIGYQPKSNGWKRGYQAGGSAVYSLGTTETINISDPRKLRLVRTGSTIQGYRWTAAGAWAAEQTAISVTSNDVVISIANHSWADSPTSTVDFDNFTVNSGTVVWPEGTSGADIVLYDIEEDTIIDVLDKPAEITGTMTQASWDNVTAALLISDDEKIWVYDDMTGILLDTLDHLGTFGEECFGITVTDDGDLMTNYNGFIRKMVGLSLTVDYTFTSGSTETRMAIMTHTETNFGLEVDTVFETVSDIINDNKFEISGSTSFEIVSDIDISHEFVMVDSILNGDNAVNDVWSDGNGIVYITAHANGVISYSVDGSGNLTYIDGDSTQPGYQDIHGRGNQLFTCSNGFGLSSYSISGGNITYRDNNNGGSGWYTGVNAASDGLVYTASASGVRSHSIDAQGIITPIDEDYQGFFCQGVWSDDNFIYVAGGSGGFMTYSSAGGVLTLLDRHDIGNAYNNVWGDGTFIYVTDTNIGLLVYSVDSLGIITYIGRREDPSDSQYKDVWGDGEFIYVSSNGTGLKAYTVDGAGNLTFEDTSPDQSYMRGISGDGNFIYVCRWRYLQVWTY